MFTVHCPRHGSEVLLSERHIVALDPADATGPSTRTPPAGGGPSDAIDLARSLPPPAAVSDPITDAGTLAMVAALAATHERSGDLDATLRTALRMLRDLGRFAMKWH